MEFIERIFLSFLQSSITTSVIILSTILILKIFNNHINIRVKNAIWILVLIKLLIPILPETNISLFSIMYEKAIHVQNKSPNSIEISQQPQMNEESISKSSYNNNTDTYIYENSNKNLISNVIKILSCIWVAGVLSLSSVLLFPLLNLKRKTKNLKKYTHTELLSIVKKCRLKVNIKSRIPVYVYDGFKSPCILGVNKPKIYIPNYILDIKDSNQLSHIFLHELVHYKRKDLFYNYLSIIALVMHWYNPLVWISVKKMKAYREYACDAYVLELLNEEENIEYGMTLLNISKILINKGNYPQIPVFFQTNTQIKDRIGLIKGFKKGSYKMTRRAIAGCALITIVVLTNNLAVEALNSENIIQVTNNVQSLENDNSEHDIDEENNVKINNNTETDTNVNETSSINENISENKSGKWIEKNGQWYFYSSNGEKIKNKVVDGYELGEDGAWIGNKYKKQSDLEYQEAITDKANDEVNKQQAASNSENKETKNKATENERSTANNTNQDYQLKPPANPDGSPVKEVISTSNTANVNDNLNTDADKKFRDAWIQEESGWHYINNEGKKTTGWLLSNGQWYHLNKNGVMDKNTSIIEDGKTYDISKNGTVIDINGR